ncbi:MAG: radical SAM family heme chaperone HemW [Anaerolineales bacterium]|jgi:oxygen-independent coproporphyrinogen-3 oxidase
MISIPYSVYIHIPFCRHRCGYCDFNTYAGKEDLIPPYVSALCREIELVSRSVGQRLPVHTIFFGGGTPSLLPIYGIQQILFTLHDCFDIQPNPEITLEANPGTVSPTYLAELHELGISRLSLGMQSAHETELNLLERQHNLEDVEHAVDWARRAGFKNLNLDLIYGLPHQTLDSWLHTLKIALTLAPEHLSLYSLTIEHGTPLHRKVQNGTLPAPDDDLSADMYETAIEQLETAGFAHYEISNFAIRDQNGHIMACEHNLQYWRNLPYLGFGAGAHGFAGNYRLSNVLRIPSYIQHVQNGKVLAFPFSPATTSHTRIDQNTEMQETMMVGLRLTREGVSKRIFLKRFEKPLEIVFRNEIKTMTQNGLLEWAGEGGDTLRLTRRGLLLGNQVFMQFIGSSS